MNDVRLNLLTELDLLEELFLDGNRLPFSGNRLVNEQEAIEVLDRIRESIPVECAKATQIVAQGNSYIQKAKQTAELLLKDANAKRDELLDSSAIMKQAQFQGYEIESKAKERCNDLLKAASIKAENIEEEMKKNLIRIEREYSAKKQKLDEDLMEYKKLLADKHLAELKSAQRNLEITESECSKIVNKANQEAKSIYNESLNYKNRIHNQCDQLIKKSSAEANSFKEESQIYAEQTLSELNKRINHLSKIVNAGLNELDRSRLHRQKKDANKENSNTEKPIAFTKSKTVKSRPDSYTNGMG